MYTFGEKLKKLRKEKGVSLATASTAMGMGRSTLDSYERGTRDPNIENINKIAKYYKVDTAELIKPELVPNYRAIELKDILDNEDITVEGRTLNDREKALIYRVIRAILFTR